VHIGSDKTGTTSIQKALSLSRDYLARSGVLYPQLANSDNHNLLAVSFRDKGRNQPRRLLRRYGSSDAVVSASRKAWLTVKQQLRQNEFHTVVLSGEHFLGLDLHHELAKQNRRIFPDLDTTQILAYLRRPSSHYVARLQQRLKAEHKILVPERVVYSARLAPWQNIGCLQLFEFNKAKLHSRDIVQDFWIRALGRLPLPQDARQIRTNKSLSAEGLYLLQRFRQSRYPDKDGTFHHGSDQLLRRILLVEESNARNASFTRLKLHRDIRNHIDYSTNDNNALLEKFGFQFDFMKEKPPHQKPSLPDLHDPLQLTDLVSVDMEKVELLVELLRTDRRVLAPRRWLLDRMLQACLEQ
jgi:hypothetical protein